MSAYCSTIVAGLVALKALTAQVKSAEPAHAKIAASFISFLTEGLLNEKNEVRERKGLFY